MTMHTEDFPARSHLSMAKRGGPCTAWLRSGESIVGTLVSAGTLAFTVRQGRTSRAVKYHDCDHVICELSL